MTTKERAELKETIQAKLVETQLKISALEEVTQPISPENSIGRVSRMDAINNKSVAEAALRIARKQYTSLEIALTKIDSAEFGICMYCKKGIQPKRLMFMPESTKCVRCAR